MGSPERAKVRVLVVDDVRTARHLIRALLETDPAITVVGEAADGAEAVRLAARLRPDVITMDVLMPVLDGYVATQRIMAAQPTAVVAVTSLPLDGGSVVARMLEAGAVGIIGKAFGRDPRASERMRRELIAKVKAAARARGGVRGGGAQRAPARAARPRVPIRIVVVAASTGGPGALLELLRGLRDDLPCPVLVVQHIAPGFGQGLAEWLSATSGRRVSVARDGERIEPGRVYLAPDDHHLLITDRQVVRLKQTPPVHSLRPAADVLFGAASQAFGAGVVALVLSGMGNDGADGARQVKAAQGLVLVQDEATCAIYGMPKATVEAGAADEVLPIGSIAGRVLELCTGETS
ncbi:MAG: chemotaxis-specific protein-glutamate methyltransferase CheB [Armatimonadetes bacterium]|nr:chemotaxis-specific protein-glutamate methyltransferase CheB [Armatimonadota bacterium]